MKLHIRQHQKDETKNKFDIKFHEEDIWNMDVTLAMIISSMLKELKKRKQGIPTVEDEFVPPELRKQEKLNDGYRYKNAEDRWNYIIDEMIYTFEHIANRDVDAYTPRVHTGLKLFAEFYGALWT